MTCVLCPHITKIHQPFGCSVHQCIDLQYTQFCHYVPITSFLPSCTPQNIFSRIITCPLVSPHSSPISLLPVPHPPPLPGPAGRGNLRPQLDSAMQDVSDLYLLMEETEKQAVRRALLEERGRYCTFINMLQPVVVGKICSSQQTFCFVFIFAILVELNVP